MASNNQPSEKPLDKGGKSDPAPGKSRPEWAGGLKQLYDSVVDEPIPDSFKDLLDKLDGEAMPPSDGKSSSGGDRGGR